MIGVQLPTSTYAEISGEAQPCHIGGQEPSAGLINLVPGVGEVADDAVESDNVGNGFNGTAETEEQRGPNQVQAKLDGVESCALLRCEAVDVSWVTR